MVATRGMAYNQNNIAELRATEKVFMAHESSWLVANRVIQLRVSESVTMEDIQDINRQLLAMLEQGTAPVHIVNDMQGLKEFPNNLIQVKSALTYMSHAKLGWESIISQPNPLVRFFASAITQIAGARMKMVPSLEEAYFALSRLDQTLPADLKTVRSG